ncbi:MAG: peptidoglycan-binding protein, partial [Fimbriimonadaceae bacterium]|nr:peptidoglycan-binding protein [Alphaproteobacteria bacterium]
MHIGKNTEMADRVLRRAAQTSSAEAYVRLAQYLTQLPAERRDDTEISDALEIAVASNDLYWSPIAMNMMGNFLLVQDSADQKAAAYTWYSRAAKYGNYHAIYQMAWAYLNGNGGLQQDDDAGMNLMHEAGDNGDYTAALLNIGTIYTNGSHGRVANRDVAVAAMRRVAEHAEAGRVPDEWMANVRQVLDAWQTTAYDPTEVQQLLTDLGYEPGRVDGKIGKATRAAIRQFQAKQDLEQNGEPSVALVLDLRWAKDRLR